MSGTSGTVHPIAYLRTLEFEDGQAAGSITPARMRDLLVSLDTGLLIARNYGVVADGSTDDTAAWGTVFSAASTGYPTAVLAPAGISMTTGITVPAGVTLVGQANCDYPLNNGAAFVTGGGSVLKKISGSNALVTMNGANLSNANGLATLQGSGLTNMTLLGAYGSAGVVQQATRTALCYLIRCTITNFTTAFDGSVTSGYAWAIIEGCCIMSNGNAIVDLVDSRVINNFIAGNSGTGFISSSGADTVIMGNKIEFNGQHGVYITGGDNMQVVNNNFDECGYNAVNWTNSTNGICSGNCIRRSGSAATAGSTYDAHFYLSGNTDLVVIGNITRVLNIQNTTTPAPNYCLAGGTNTSGILNGNAFRGYHTAFNNPSAATGLTLGTNLT